MHRDETRLEGEGERVVPVKLTATSLEMKMVRVRDEEKVGLAPPGVRAGGGGSWLWCRGRVSSSCLFEFELGKTALSFSIM